MQLEPTPPVHIPCINTERPEMPANQSSQNLKSWWFERRPVVLGLVTRGYTQPLTPMRLQSASQGCKSRQKRSVQGFKAAGACSGAVTARQFRCGILQRTYTSRAEQKVYLSNHSIHAVYICSVPMLRVSLAPCEAVRLQDNVYRVRSAHWIRRAQLALMRADERPSKH